jgi:AmmeMemoRadiSam system protein B
MDEYPRLRALEVFPLQEGGKTLVCLRDPLRIAQTLVVSPAAYFILGHLDGRHTLLDIQEAYNRQFGELLLSHELQEFLETVDQNLFLYNERFLERQSQVVEEFRRQPTRPAAHAGTVYKQDPRELENQLEGYFRAPDGPGPALQDTLNPAPKALVAPHIDFHRGGPWYAWVYRELMQSEGADLYVLLGTSHCGGLTPFILTEKDFETPWGLVETDREFVRRLQEGYSADLFVDEYLHRGEHSLEFQVIFLKYVSLLQERRGGRSRPFKIVPILVSSFHPMVETNTAPEKEPRIGSFLRNLREQIERESRRVCLVAGVDLAHVGAQFGDPETITPSFLDWVQAEDLRLIDRLTGLDGPGFFHEVAKDQDRRRICGFSPLYSLIHLLDGSRGRVLQYRQAFTRETNSAVTFTSVVFS